MFIRGRVVCRKLLGPTQKQMFYTLLSRIKQNIYIIIFTTTRTQIIFDCEQTGRVYYYYLTVLQQCFLFLYFFQTLFTEQTNNNTLEKFRQVISLFCAADELLIIEEISYKLIVEIKQTKKIT